MKLFAALSLALTFSIHALADQPLKVLFVGNSQMYSYDLPTMIKLMSKSAPSSSPRIEPGRAIAGGATLKRLKVTLWDVFGDGKK